MKKSEDTKLLKRWREEVKANADCKCEICGKFGESHNAHHYFGRKNRSTRWLIQNGIYLCYTCHVGGVKSAHESPEWFRGEILLKRGNEWLESLTKTWNETFKGTYDMVMEHLNGNKKTY